MIPAYNEEATIEDHINNLVEVYPKDKMGIIISNDGFADNTEELAQNALKDHNINGKVITHTRSGLNKAINRGINETSSEIIVITGSDGLFDENTILDLLSVLLSADDIGAVSGNLIPVAKGESVFSKSEAATAPSTAEYAPERANCAPHTVSMVRCGIQEKSFILPQTPQRMRMMPAWHCP